MIRRLLAAVAAALLWCGSPAWAGVELEQGGAAIVPGHAASWTYNGIIGDPGGAAGVPSGGGRQPITDLGITAPGTPFCINDAYTNASGGYHQLCLGANALGGGLISYNAIGGATPDGLQINLNGVNYPFPGAGNGNVIAPTDPEPIAGDAVIFNGDTTVKDAGFPPGNVSGPSSSTDLDAVLWNNTTGSLVEDAGAPPGLSLTTNVALAAFPTMGSAFVLRQDFASGLGAPSLIFGAESGTCSANDRTNDGASCVDTSSGGNSWVGNFPTSGDDPREWGAKCDGSTDDATAIQAAVNYAALSGDLVQWPGRTCLSDTEIVVPAGTGMGGVSLLPGTSSGVGGSILECPNTISCLEFTGGSSLLGTTQVSNLTVLGVGATPASGTIGLEFLQGYNVVANNLNAQNFDTCIEWKAVGTGGISFNGSQIFSSRCQTHYYVFDGWPEARIIGGRAGTDGSGDFAATSDFVDLTNTDCSSGGCGPNGISFTNYQFNPGAGGVACAVRWGGFVNGPSGTIGASVDFDHVRWEWHTYTGSGSQGIFCSDNTTTIISQLTVSHSRSATGEISVPLFNLNSATELQQWTFDHNNWGCTGATLAPDPTGAPGFNNVTFDHEFGCASLSVTAEDGADEDNVLHLTDDVWNDLTVAGQWFNLSSSNDTYFGSLTDTATGHVSWTNNRTQSWTPVLTTGGSSSGWTDTASGLISRTSDGGFTATYNLSITAKGSVTSGTMLLTGLPYECGSGAIGSAPIEASGLTGLTAGVSAAPGDGSTEIGFSYPTTSGQTGVTDAQLTGTVTLIGTVHCVSAE